MNSPSKLRVAVAGLGFGAEFVPIYLDHPDVQSVAVCDFSPERLERAAGRYSIARRFTNLDEVLASDEVDAVHLGSGIPDHARQSIAILDSGKHCACAVPMATSIADLHAIIAAARRSRRNYMMLETAVYTRPYFLVRELYTRGELGRIQFLRGAHYQDMEGWPAYWAGLPPMWYATHAIAPLLALPNARAVSVRCLGSGAMRDELTRPYNNPYPIETALFELDAPSLSAEVTRALFHSARASLESFSVYGENGCYDWQINKENPLLFRMTPVVPGQMRTQTTERPEPPDRAELLPAAIRRYTKRFTYPCDNNQPPFEVGGGHHGSHPHLVHEFIRSIIESRASAIDPVTAANWTAAGICAHESALGQGRVVTVPKFD